MEISLWVHIWESQEFTFLTLVLILKDFMKWWIFMHLWRVILYFLISIHFCFHFFTCSCFYIETNRNQIYFLHETLCLRQCLMNINGVSLLQHLLSWSRPFQSFKVYIQIWYDGLINVPNIHKSIHHNQEHKK